MDLIRHIVWLFFRRLRTLVHTNILLKHNTRNKANVNRTIICNMCLGGILSHERGLQFRSPFINLMIPADEFVELIRNLEQNVNSDIKDITNDSPYPIGLLANKYHLHFIHYSDFDTAVKIWRKRSKRIDYNHIYCILVQTASCTMRGVKLFQKAQLYRKIALTRVEDDVFSYTYGVKNYDGKNINGEILMEEGWFGCHVYDKYNWNNFLEL